ncbi:MAG: isopentenyl-diphosphate Delta-isomerase [Alsobacter sp.]
MTSNALRRADLDPQPIMIPGIAADGGLYPIEKMEAHQSGAFHLAISVFVFSRGELLIQRRALGKYHCGGQWANTCCTHPHWGEDAALSARRRLREELGFSTPLRESRIVDYWADVGSDLVENERVHMFLGEVDRDTLRADPDPSEVAEIRWVGAAQLRSEIAATPLAFTPWFRIYVSRFPDLAF